MHCSHLWLGKRYTQKGSALGEAHYFTLYAQQLHVPLLRLLELS